MYIYIYTYPKKKSEVTPPKNSAGDARGGGGLSLAVSGALLWHRGIEASADPRGTRGAAG